MGSLNLVVLQFPGALMPYDFLNELRDIWDSGHVRPNAFILLRKDKSGAIAGMEGGRVMEEQDIAATNAVLAAIASQRSGRSETARSKMETAINAAAKGDFGLSMADVKSVAKKLPRNHSAIIILFENTWERRLKQVAAKCSAVMSGVAAVGPMARRRCARPLLGHGSGEPECPGPSPSTHRTGLLIQIGGGLPLHPDRCIIDVSYSSVGEAGVWSFFKRFRSQSSTKIFQSERAAGRGMRQLAEAIEKQGFRVVGGISYDDARRPGHIFNVKSCWLVSVDGAEDSATRWQILEEVCDPRFSSPTTFAFPDCGTPKLKYACACPG